MTPSSLKVHRPLLPSARLGEPIGRVSALDFMATRWWNHRYVDVPVRRFPARRCKAIAARAT